MGLEGFKDCLPTARFLKIFNDAFDILNSRNSYVKGFKKSISKENSVDVLTKIDEIQNYISQLKTVKNIPIVKTQSQTGFIAFYIGLEIVKLIYTDLITNNKISSYETYCACQDHLEIFFSAVRSRNGWCTNPSVLQFKSALKSLIVHTQTKYANNGNCEEIEALPILHSIEKDQKHRLNRVSLFKSDHRIVVDNENQGKLI